MTDEKKNKAGADPNNLDEENGLQEVLTYEGEPIFSTVETDGGPDEIEDDLAGSAWAESLQKATQGFIEDTATGKAIKSTIKQILKSEALSDTREAISAASREAIKEILTPEQLEALRAISETVQPLTDLLDEIEALQPYIETELQKPEYNGATVKDLLNEYCDYNGYVHKDSPLEKALQAARAKRDTIEAQNAGRRDRRAIRQKAEERGAIMELKGGIVPFFSDKDFRDALSNGRICRMGKLDPDYIDRDTGLVNKTYFDEDDFESLSAAEISLLALTLLTAITANTVGDIYDEFVQGGQITFYVKGVLEKFTDDPRTLEDRQLDINRKTAGVLYLENLFIPLQNYIGTTNDGSRYSVFNYVGYEADADTMTIRTPYLYQLFRSTQHKYAIEKRRASEQAAQTSKKSKKKKHNKGPSLNLNLFFKGKAITIDQATLEIAVYITNVILTAGEKSTKTKLQGKSIIKNCPTFAENLAAIDNAEDYIIDENGNQKKANKPARYNTELRKIQRAFNLIQDPKRCRFLEKYELVSVSPAKETGKGDRKRFELKPPTKSTLSDNIIIEYKKRPEE